MSEPFTDAARDVISRAATVTAETGGGKIRSSHLLVAILEKESFATRLLAATGVTADKCRPMLPQPTDGENDFTAESKRVFELGFEHARALHQESIGPDHLLLGILAQPESSGSQVLRHLGVNLASVSESLQAKLSDRSSN